MIEPNPVKFEELKTNCAGLSGIVPICGEVGLNVDNRLDALLARTAIPSDFDFLSIDIDGNDYHIWQSITKYAPKVVCIEYNPTIPNEVVFIQEYDPAIGQGASLAALVRLAKAKGYELVSTVRVNAFFVKEEFLPLYEISDNSPDVLRQHLELITYLFVGFDGKVFLAGHRQLPWHGIELSAAKIQHLPWFLRKYPSYYSPPQRAAYIGFKAFSRLRSKARSWVRRLLRRPSTSAAIMLEERPGSER